jgi:hypothetical protein
MHAIRKSRVILLWEILHLRVRITRMSRSMDQTNFREWREDITKQQNRISLTFEIS